jgi:hypothetical protein
MVEGSKPLGKPKRRCENIKMDIKYTACVSQGSSVSIVSGYRLDDRAIGVRSPAGQRIFPLASVSRPALGSTQPLVKWVPGALSPGLKRGQGVTLTTHHYLVLRF